MDAKPFCPTNHASLVALTSARAKLDAVLQDTMRRRLSARLALWAAQAALLDPEFPVAPPDGSPAASPVELSALMTRLAAEEAQLLRLIARLDARIEDVSRVVEWSTH